MENYTITKEQVLKLANKAEQGCTNVIKSDLKNWFSDAFKTELEVGRWYKENDYPMHIFFITAIKDNRYYYYGFRVDGKYEIDEWYSFDDIGSQNGFELATKEEVSEALIAEAKKRGYKGGIKLSPLEYCSNAIETEKEDVYSYIPKVSHYVGNRLQLNGTGIYQDGNWAEIIPQEKTVVPIAKALKIIAKKMKVSPENIEIKN